MKKFFIILILFATIFVTVAARSYEISIAELNEIVDQTNFIVGSGCSGTLISLKPHLVLTNYHCIDRNVRTITRNRENERGVVESVKEIKLEPVQLTQVMYRNHETVGNTSYVSEIVARQKDRDLALLQIKATTIPHSRISVLLPKEAAVVRGEKVWAVGNPAGLDATITAGIVSSVNRTFRFSWAENEDLPMIQTDVGLFGGNSGGALYNATGHLVGVPTAGVGQAGHLGLAIPAFIVWDFLEKHCKAEYLGSDNNQLCNEDNID
jgi:S1-C subfamily serine protease